MSARKQEINLQVNQLLDALLLGLAFWLAHMLRHNRLIILDNLPEIDEFKVFFWMLAVIMPFGPFLLELQGYYSYPLEKTVWKSLTQMARATVWLVVLLGLAVIFLRLLVPSRSVLLLFMIIAPFFLLLKERILAWNYLRLLKRGAAGEWVILAGESIKMQQILDSLTPIQKLELHIAETIDLEHSDVEKLVDALHRHSVGRVILAFSRVELEKVQKVIEACEIEGVEAWLNADFIRTSVARPTYDVLASRPMLVFRATPDVSWSLTVKAVLDRVGAAMGMVFLSPLFLIAAIGVRTTSPGRIFFSQKRAGLHGKPFTMYKFRTMNTDAEMQRAELEAFNLMSGPVFKVENDPRITPFGAWLRKTSIDELPQLWNVLCGEMSLVGPRPLPIYEVEKFESASHRRRLSMKPGLTCLWQIQGRNTVTDFSDWVRLDLQYIDHWSLGLDLWILARTVPVVLVGLGAK